MKGVAYNSIIALILLSILGIILSQGWLLYKQYEYKERVFQRTVTNLLFEIEREIEEKITSNRKSSSDNKYYFKVNEEQVSYYSQFIYLEDYVYAETINYQLDTHLILDRTKHLKALLKQFIQTAPGIDTLERLIQYQKPTLATF